MSLMIVAARAALLKQAGVGRLAAAAGGLGALGLGGVAAAREIAKPTPLPADAVGEGVVPELTDPYEDSPLGQKLTARGWTRPAGGWQSPHPTLRERIRAGVAGLATGGAGTVLGKWYGAATGKGAAQ